jgi:hypothetical protein
VSASISTARDVGVIKVYSCVEIAISFPFSSKREILDAVVPASTLRM